MKVERWELFKPRGRVPPGDGLARSWWSGGSLSPENESIREHASRVDEQHRSYERAKHNYPECPLARIAATLSVFVGTLIVGFNPNRWDQVVMDLPRGHGIHLHEVAGVALIAVGIVLFWRRPIRTPE